MKILEERLGVADLEEALSAPITTSDRQLAAIS
jgi:hypothetical protein